MANAAYLAALLLLGYLVIVAVAYINQHRMLYLPDQFGREPTATPADIGLSYTEVTLTAADGVELHGWHVPAAAERGAVALFHGNAGNIGHRLETLRLLNDLGLATLIIDYRGYGRSEGQPSEAGTYRDAEAVWHHLSEERDIDPDRIVVFGRSLGAAIAARLAARHTPAALILESPFTSVPELAAEIYPYLPVRWLSRYRYATADYAAQAACPLLVIHSSDDDIVPIAHGRAVYQRASGPKRFLELTGGHNAGFVESHRIYREGWAAFLAEHLDQAKAP
ncbi:alpha/beta hydrolase [Thiohalorhabdus sp.]|uniref:alpha/beta hydrolase n=1 Tax=Thiohalorhabdus sp. TaxID=3094134 RepID=UPI002FC28337